MKPNQLQMASEVIACLHVHMYMYTRVLFLAFMHAGAPAERRQALRGEAVRSRPASAVTPAPLLNVSSGRQPGA